MPSERFDRRSARRFAGWFARWTAVLSALCWSHPQPASASDRMVGVTALDDARRTRQVARRLRERLQSPRVATPDAVETRLEQRALPAPEGGGRAAASMRSDVEAAVEMFFERGPGEALEPLDSAFARGLRARSLRAHRPRVASAVRRAGVYTVRALLERGERQRAGRRAARLVGAFPTAGFPADEVPPDARQVLRSAREESIGEEHDRLEFDVSDPCRPLVGGLAADSPVVRPRGSTPPVSLACDGDVVWARELPGHPGSAQMVPMVRRVRRAGSDPRGQRWRPRASRRLSAVRYWATLDAAVGVVSAEERTWIGRAGTEGSGRWIEVSQQREDRRVRRAVERLAPAWVLAPPPAGAGGGSGGRRWVAPTLVAGGAALAGGSAVYLATAVRERSDELRCSPETSGAGPSSPGCRGVRTLVFDGDNLDRARRRLTAAKIGGWTGVALGGGAVVWGVMRFLSRGRRSTASRRFEPRVRPGRASFVFSF